MPVDWMDVSSLSFTTLLLLERVQLSWFPGWAPETELAVALHANPTVEWYLRHKCPELRGWLDGLLSSHASESDSIAIRSAEIAVLRRFTDLLVYVVDPAIYDAQPFLRWDSTELTSLVDFTGKTVIDVGAGTGRLAMVAAEIGEAVFAVEPVANLRYFLRQKARRAGLTNVYPADGLITDIPFPAVFADVTMGGHVFGDEPESEHQEMERVTKPDGMIILCPGNNDLDNDRHRFLLARGFDWSRFEEPEYGIVRKYWKTGFHSARGASCNHNAI